MFFYIRLGLPFPDFGNIEYKPSVHDDTEHFKADIYHYRHKKPFCQQYSTLISVAYNKNSHIYFYHSMITCKNLVNLVNSAFLHSRANLLRHDGGQIGSLLIISVFKAKGSPNVGQF